LSCDTKEVATCVFWNDQKAVVSEVIADGFAAGLGVCIHTTHVHHGITVVDVSETASSKRRADGVDTRAA